MTRRCTCSYELRSFRPMSCSPGVVSPSRFARTKSPHLHLCLWVPFLERRISTYFFACLFVLDSLLERSEKNLEHDLIHFILRSSRKRLWQNDFIFRANRLSVRANRTSGERTCFCSYIKQ